MEYNAEGPRILSTEEVKPQPMRRLFLILLLAAFLIGTPLTIGMLSSKKTESNKTTQPTNTRSSALEQAVNPFEEEEVLHQNPFASSAQASENPFGNTQTLTEPYENPFETLQ